MNGDGRESLSRNWSWVYMRQRPLSWVSVSVKMTRSMRLDVNKSRCLDETWGRNLNEAYTSDKEKNTTIQGAIEESCPVYQAAAQTMGTAKQCDKGKLSIGRERGRGDVPGASLAGRGTQLSWSAVEGGGGMPLELQSVCFIVSGWEGLVLFIRLKGIMYHTRCSHTQKTETQRGSRESPIHWK